MLARSWESYCPSVRPSNACFVTNPKNLPAIFYTTWKGNPSIYSQMWFFVQWCSSWQDLNWLEASRGPSVIAELLVRNGEHEILMLWYMLHSNDKHRLLQKIPDGPGTTFGWLDSGTETTSVLQPGSRSNISVVTSSSSSDSERSDVIVHVIVVSIVLFRPVAFSLVRFLVLHFCLIFAGSVDNQDESTQWLSDVNNNNNNNNNTNICNARNYTISQIA